MSLPDEEATALERARAFLLSLSSGEYRVDSIKALRADARGVVKHYPLAAGERWLDKHTPTTYTDNNSTEKSEGDRDGEED